MDNVKASQPSADFVMAFAELSKRLARINVTVYQLCLYYGGFGGWEIIATKGDEAIKLSFDGKEALLLIRTSPIEKYRIPDQWQDMEVKPIGKRYAEAISYAEHFLKDRFGKSPN